MDKKEFSQFLIEHEDDLSTKGRLNEFLFNVMAHEFGYDLGMKKCAWLSIEEKSIFDFIIELDNQEVMYIDIVSAYRHRNDTYRLVTGHKDWNEKFEFLEEENDGKNGYIVFVDPNYHTALRFFRNLVETYPDADYINVRLPRPEEFHFLKITDGLPHSDIVLNDTWKRQLRKIDTVCGINFYCPPDHELFLGNSR